MLYKMNELNLSTEYIPTFTLRRSTQCIWPSFGEFWTGSLSSVISMSIDATSAKRVKLRNSCDSCNLAKVRCSKARPLCTRCASHNLQCVYSVSLRSSAFRTNHNASSKIEAASKRAVSTEALTAESMTLPKPPQVPSGGSNSFSAPSLLSIMESTPLDQEWASNVMEEDSLSSIAGLTSIDSMPFELQYPSPHDEDSSTANRSISSENSNASTAGVHYCLKDHTLTSSPAESTTSLPPDEYSTANFADQQRRSVTTPVASCSCAQLVLRKLFACSKIPSVPLSWDVALNHIKETTALCTSVIHCHICHNSNASHVLAIAALIAKIISISYTTFDSDHYSQVDSPSQPCNPLSDVDSVFDFNLLDGGDRAWSLDAIDHDSCFRASAAAPSIIPPSALSIPALPTGQVRWTLGAYSLDSKDEKRLKLEICKIEFSKVLALFQEFKKRFCVTASHDDHTKPETKLCHDTAAYLEQKLVVTAQRLRVCY